MLTVRISWMYHIQETKCLLPPVCLEKIHSCFQGVFAVGRVLAFILTLTFHGGCRELFQRKGNLGSPEIKDWLILSLILCAVVQGTLGLL